MTLVALLTFTAAMAQNEKQDCQNAKRDCHKPFTAEQCTDMLAEHHCDKKANCDKESDCCKK